MKQITLHIAKAGILLTVSMGVQATLTLDKINHLSTGLGPASAEISSYDKNSQKLFVINSGYASYSIFDFSNPALASVSSTVSLSSYGAGPNSIASFNGIVAVAVEAHTVTDNGSVVFFDSTGNHIKTVQVGALPDMLTFTQDGTKLVVANEGEPDVGVNPIGSVSIIDISNGVINATVNTLDFVDFNVGQPRHVELNDDVIIAPGEDVAVDLEPEYVAISDDGQQAYVTLQENNAVAVVDLITLRIDSVQALGFKDHSIPGNELDPSDRDGVNGAGAININNWPVKGIYMPDAIAAVTLNDTQYYLTANEGDARDADKRIKNLTLDPAIFPDFSDLQSDEQLGRLDAQSNLGMGVNGYTDLYIYGGRSFSIWNAETGNQVFDSGSEMAFKIAEINPGIFNANNSSADDFDERSDNKGAEPEGITTAEINGKNYAFIGLERVGGIMIYDISTPSLAQFEHFQAATDGDVAPEGLLFIPASDNATGQNLLLVSYEDTGTIGVFRLVDVIFKNTFE